MYYVRLFTNQEQWNTPNDIQELNCAGYQPIRLTNKNSFLNGKGVVFDISDSVNVYGCYVTSAEGDLVFYQRFGDAPFAIPQGGGAISVEFSK